MPARSRCVLGIDIGTTAVKAIALGADQRAIASGTAAHDLRSPRPGWAEGDPAAWWENAVEATRQVGGALPLEAVAAVGVSGMVPALVLLDAGGRVLRPAIQQNDARAAAEIEWLARHLDGDAFFRATGQPLSQQLVPPRLLWLREHEPAVYRAIHRMLGSYDYVTWRLTGEWSLEHNWALESGLWDAGRRALYAPMLEPGAADPRWLPPVRAPHEIVGAVGRAAAAATGLPAGTPVIAGSADHVAAALAAGAGPHTLVLKIGGGGDVLYGLDRFAPDPRLYIDYHDLPGQYLLNGCMTASGSLVKWFATGFAPDLDLTRDGYARLDAEAAPVPAGSEGLVVLPYFLGEKTPVLDASARGVVFGLTLTHGRAHVHRALLEAVAYGFRHHVEVLEEGGHPIDRVRIMDRGARSPLWRQIVADVLGREVEYAPGADLGSAHGVAWVAGVAAGLWGWDSPPAPAGAVEVARPIPAHTTRYGDLYRLYRDLYRRLREDFPRLGASPAPGSEPPGTPAPPVAPS